MDKAQEKIAQFLSVAQRIGAEHTFLDVWGNARTLLKELEELGYRKPPDRPELRNFLSAVAKGVAEKSITIDDAVDRILVLIPGELPKDKPPLLTDEQIFVQFHHDGESFEGEARQFVKSHTGKRVVEIAQAQWNIWSEWYGGEQ